MVGRNYFREILYSEKMFPAINYKEKMFFRNLGLFTYYFTKIMYIYQ